MPQQNLEPQEIADLLAFFKWVGGIFSSLEPMPIILMVWDTFRHVKERQAKIVNPWCGY
jgi:nitric oxide reductase subunit B